jgi:ubiquitin C-terminal hydrolase
MNGDNKYECTPCKTKYGELQDAEKFNNIILPPKTLVIQLGRFYWGEDSAGNLVKNKIKTKINFPITDLKLNDMYFKNYSMSFIHNSAPSTDGRDVYDLWGVIEHQGGNMNCGHYVCYCKNLENGNWYKFNDNHVHHVRNEVLEATIINEGSYILFYALKQ